MERMDDFFTARVEDYDEHMLMKVKGCKKAYKKMAELIPDSCRNLLDIGCGTGLELDEIFKVLPDISVTGIDLTQAMLDKLIQKHHDKSINLICGNYFDIDFGSSKYDCAVSFQTMHHFSHQEKIGLYSRLHKSLKDSGLYIESDYMVIRQADEDLYYAENKRIRKELNIPESEFYHYDTPCTINNQLSMLTAAGFSKTEKVIKLKNTTIIIAYK